MNPICHRAAETQSFWELPIGSLFIMPVSSPLGLCGQSVMEAA
jgi:hypothetical protein